MNRDVPVTHYSRTASRERIFWDVDTQVDFMLPGGKLYASGAERIIPNLARLTQHARRRHILVVASTDAHKRDDAEFAQWPPHCIVGTLGQQKIRETRLKNNYVLPNMPAEVPDDLGRFEQIILEKQKVDVFTNPNVEALLKRLGSPEVTLYGVVTEVCVNLAAQGLLSRGYRVRLVTDAIWALGEEEGSRSVAELERGGAQLVTTDEVLSRNGSESVVQGA